MMYRNQTRIDFSALVDIISNVAGMMILLACVAIIVKHRDQSASLTESRPTKPISFPLAYIPDKHSLTIGLKYGKLYELPERELLDAVANKTTSGESVQWLDIEKAGVSAKIELTPTATGFRFQYKFNPDGGIALDEARETVETLDRIMERFPPAEFFYVFHAWPECFNRFRDVREYLLESGVEVGWVPRLDDPESYDVVYSMGEYDDDLTTIKAQ